MAEEKAKKKKLRIVGQIFKWLAIGVLTLLLILGLIFRAPWKVTVLLAILLLAFTALPGPARKWFWLSVCIVITALLLM